MAEYAGVGSVRDHQGDRQGLEDQPVLCLTRTSADAACAGESGEDRGEAGDRGTDNGGGDGGVSGGVAEATDGCPQLVNLIGPVNTDCKRRRPRARRN